MKKAEEMTVEELRDRLTPKKPIVKTKDWGEIRALAYCPTCGTLFFQFNEHCCDCGQALDWSEARENERLKYLFEDSDAGIDVQKLIKKVEFLEGSVDYLQCENGRLSEAKFARDRLFDSFPGKSFIHKGVECKLYHMYGDTEFKTYDGRRAWCIKGNGEDDYTGLVYVAGDDAPSWWCCCYIDKFGRIGREYVVPAMEECANIKRELQYSSFPQYTLEELENMLHLQDNGKKVLAIMGEKDAEVYEEILSIMEAQNDELSDTEAANGQ